MLTRRAIGAALAAAAAVVAGCANDAEPRTVIEIPDAQPGDLIALRASDTEPGVVEWIDRRAGTIHSVDTTDPGAGARTVATIEVGADGAQRGLLGHTMIDGVRYAAWTDPDTEHLIVGALVDPNGDGPAIVDRVLWDGGGTAGGAVGGHLDRTADGQLILGIGQLTDWAKANGSGAMLQLDPQGPPDQTPMILSDGYTNPFAFTVTAGLDEPSSDGQLWVADNAVGDDTERIGSGDVGRFDHPTTGGDPRAPSAMAALPDGRLAICGFLDGRLQAWQASPPEAGDDLGPCLTGVALLADGTLVTATATELVAIAP